jgi:hypothetical protein
MFTVNSLLSHFVDAGKLWFAGDHYRDGDAVYTGDLWRLWPSPDGLESKNRNRFESLAERKGIQLRFEDEIITDEQGRAHEINPGYHGQIATYRVIESSVWAQDEAQENPDSYLDALLEQDGHASDRWLTEEQLTERGFIRFDYDAESGFHRGQTDTPESVIDRLKLNRPTAKDFLFIIDDVGQFDCHFHLWYRLPEEEEEE